ncbi:MAG: exonuclease domain-containing protein [Balneolaceae bacterium]
MTYSIVDLETTGFSPKRGDKILEISVVKVQDDKVVDKYSTLVNPERDISNYHIHGVEPEIVKKAPLFADIKGFLINFLSGSTLVAHNAAFDFRFLEHELLDQNNSLEGICTIQLSRLVDSSIPSRNLDTLCSYYDISHQNNHQALADAMATANLFLKLKQEYCNSFGESKFRHELNHPFETANISTAFSRIEYKRDSALNDLQREKLKLQLLVTRLPTDSISKNESSRQYLDLLCEILSDRMITDLELKELEELIEDLSLSKKELIKLHKQYLREVIHVYLLDGIVSEFEYLDLKNLSDLLGISVKELDELLMLSKASLNSLNKIQGMKGKSICFTGQLRSKFNNEPVDRTTAQKIAQQHGLVIKKGVSKKLNYLVTADPSSMSGKAKKAKELKVKILAEPEFWRILGISVE